MLRHVWGEILPGVLWRTVGTALLAALLLAWLAEPLRAQDCDIRAYGAVNGLLRVNTAAIQAAVDACAGGRVVVPEGIFPTGTIHLRDRTHLYLAQDAVLLGSFFLDDFPEIRPGVHSSAQGPGNRALLYAEGVSDITIDGPGRIDANGLLTGGYFPKPKPVGLRLVSCRNVRIADLQLYNAGSWMLHVLDCEAVLLHGLHIYNHGNPLCDGLDIDSSRDVRVEFCDIDSYDDALALKTSAQAPLRNVRVQHCTLRSSKRAIKFGTESLSDMQDVSIRHCKVARSRRCLQNPFPAPAKLGILVAMVDGGTLRDVVLEDLDLQGIETPFFVVQGKRQGRTSAITGLRMSDIRAVALGTEPSVIAGLAERPVADIRLENLQLTAPGGGGPAAQPLPAVDPAAKPSHEMFGTQLPASGLLLRNVSGALLRRVCLDTEADDGRPHLAMIESDGEGLLQESYSSGACFIRSGKASRLASTAGNPFR